MAKKYDYIVVDQVISAPETSAAEHEKFIDEFIELVEKFGWLAGGGISSFTKEEMDEYLKDTSSLTEE